MKVSALEGGLLDFWVAKAEGKATLILNDECFLALWHSPNGDVGLGSYSPSTDWSQGGPILEREGIEVTFDWDHKLTLQTWWTAHRSRYFISTEDRETSKNGYYYGESYLIAAMRCYVASRFGVEVDDS